MNAIPKTLGIRCPKMSCAIQINQQKVYVYIIYFNNCLGETSRPQKSVCMNTGKF